MPAGGLGLELPSPEARTDSDNLAKNTGEMGLVAHSAVKCDPRKRLLSVLHDDLGVPYPSYSDIGHGRLTETPSECAREVADAELRDAGEIRNVEAEADVRLDVGDHAFCLPGGEATPISPGPDDWKSSLQRGFGKGAAETRAGAGD